MMRAILLGLALSACAPVAPWERGTLARRPMRTDDPARVEARKTQLHMLGAREASAGASGDAGGGCGCR